MGTISVGFEGRRTSRGAKQPEKEASKSDGLVGETLGLDGGFLSLAQIFVLGYAEHAVARSRDLLALGEVAGHALGTAWLPCPLHLGGFGCNSKLLRRPAATSWFCR